MPKSNAERTILKIDPHIKEHSVILFSPHSRSRNLFMSSFLARPGVYLHTLRKQEGHLTEFANGLVAELGEFFPDFGAQTLQAMENGPVNLADALIADLERLKSSVEFLILDDFDNLAMNADVAAFFGHLVLELPPGLSLVINARNLWYPLWDTFLQSGRAVLLGEKDILDTDLEDSLSADKPRLEVYSFGTGHVYMNGLPIDTWDGPLPRNLFFYFIDHPTVTRDEIFETFWPGMATKEATNVYHVTKRKVSERLGYELTTYASGFYRPSDELRLYYDVSSFEHAIVDASEGSETATIALHHAVKLYRYEFLHTINMPWMVERREQLRQSYANALVSMGRTYKALKENDKARGFYLRALHEIPEREDIHRDVMTIYAERGERNKVVEQYKYLIEVLKRLLDITPSAATRQHYNALTDAANS